MFLRTNTKKGVELGSTCCVLCDLSLNLPVWLWWLTLFAAVSGVPTPRTPLHNVSGSGRNLWCATGLGIVTSWPQRPGEVTWEMAYSSQRLAAVLFSDPHGMSAFGGTWRPQFPPLSGDSDAWNGLLPAESSSPTPFLPLLGFPCPEYCGCL